MTEYTSFYPQPQVPEAAADSTLNPDWQQVEGVRQSVLAALLENHIETDGALFAGFNPASPKQPDGEFALPDGMHHFYFGTEASLSIPTATDSEEQAGEKWVANPLSYAMRPGHLLGVYDGALLADKVVEHDDEFGTVVVAATQAQIDATRRLTLATEQ